MISSYLFKLYKKKGKIMNIANNWKDYEILDMADGEKLERWGNVILVRPDPQIIWKEKTFPNKWKKINARYKQKHDIEANWK
jgi:23S rRNA (cytosine1962-C5)-methyltransferase